MYPMKLIPAYKDYLWGGNRLRDRFGKKSPLPVLAESWEVSCHEEGLSRIAEGIFQGRTLKEVLEEKGNAWIGSMNRTPGILPVLVKLIDAQKPLSIQVHPSDENADATRGEQGKAEMWYILDALPGALIYYGFKHPLTEEEMIAHAQDGSILHDLNPVSVHTGESYYILPGMVHALGGGIMVAEVQQSSNTTFRIYDYQRKDASGNLRPLHIERAVQTAHRDSVLPKEERSTSVVRFPGVVLTELFRCKYFRVTKLKVEKSVLLDCDATSFHALLWLTGDAFVFYQGRKYSLQAGESCFLPAGLGVYEMQGQGEALLIRL